MGKSGSKPYVIDDFDSNDDVEELDSWRQYHFMRKVEQKHGPVHIRKHDQKVGTSGRMMLHRASQTTRKGLKKLLKFQEKTEYDRTKKTAYLLIGGKITRTMSTTITSEDVFTPGSVKMVASSTATSSWSSKSQERLKVKSSSHSLMPEVEDDKDIIDGGQNTPANLVGGYDKCQVVEKRVAKVSLSYSGIPRPTWRSMNGTNTPNSVGKVSNRSRTKRSHSKCLKYCKEANVPRCLQLKSVTPSDMNSVQMEQPIHDANLSLKTFDMVSLAVKSHSSFSHKSFFGKPNSNSVISLDKEREISERSFTRESTLADSNNQYDTSKRDVRSTDISWHLKKTVRRCSGIPVLKSRQDKHQMLKNAAFKSTTSKKEHNENPISISPKAAFSLPEEELDPSVRKVLDLKRWYCICRPQYKTACGISSVVSCWNFLFSTMGHGSLRPITQEAALKLLGFSKTIDELDFSLFADNMTLFRWFHQLSMHFKVTGRCCFMYKPVGRNRTVGTTDQMALGLLKQGLRDPSSAVIYHCYKHFLCPIGYEDTSEFSEDAYRGTVGGNVESCILIADTSRQYCSLHCVSWKQICLDLNCKNPNYFDIRQAWKGVMLQTNTTVSVDDNAHCIMLFQKVTECILKSLNFISSSISNTNSPTVSLLPYMDNPRSSPKHQQTAKLLSLDIWRRELSKTSNANALKDEEVIPMYYDSVVKSPNEPYLYYSLSPRTVLPSKRKHKFQKRNDRDGSKDQGHVEVTKESSEEHAKCDVFLSNNYDDDSDF